MWSELALSFQQGNLYLYGILGLFFFSTVVICERMVMYQTVYNLDFKKFIKTLKKMIQAMDHDRAKSFCRSVSKTSLPFIAVRAIEALEDDPSSVRGIIEEDTIDFLPRVEARLGILPPLASFIMILGIIGTIDALWSAFHSIDILDTSKKQAALAQGIAGALNPTAMSLVASLMILAGHQVLLSIARALVDGIHHGVAVVSNLLIPQMVPTMMAAQVAEAELPIQEPEKEDIFSSPEDDFVEESTHDTGVEDIKDEEEII